MNAVNANSGEKRWWLWCALLGTAGWLALCGDKSPSSSVAAVSLPTRPPAPARPTPPTSSLDTQGAAGTQQALELVVERDQLIAAAPVAAASNTARGTAQRDLFSARNWNPPLAPPPAPPPVAPPLPFAFLGKKLEGQTWEVYLSRGEQTFIVREGQTLESVWRVDKIAPPSIALTYLPLDQVQTLTIGDSR